MNVAIIPARGGSKRIPRKNIADFCGKPMMAWPIEVAIATGLFERIIVSTDDSEIAEVAVRHGAEAPFTRPANLADDYTGTTRVVRHALEWLVAHGCTPDLACCIYPTAPLIQSSDLLAGFSAMASEDWQYAFAVTDFDFPPHRALLHGDNGGVRPLFPEHTETRSQDLPHTIHDAGQFYWGRRNAWLSEAPIFGFHSKPIPLPRWRVQDIDTPDDWKRAVLLKRLTDSPESDR